MMAGSPRRSFRSLLLVSLVILTCGFLGVVFGQKIGTDSGAYDSSDLNTGRRSFSQIYTGGEQNYAEQAGPGKRIYHRAIPSMLPALDPQSDLFPPTSYAGM